MFIVTGGAGFIGSNIIKALNDAGCDDILVVDNLKNGTKFANLVDLEIADYMDKRDFLVVIKSGRDFGKLDGVFHEGACSSTTEWDGQYMMDNNYQYSRTLLEYCLRHATPFLYASSAAVYGGKNEIFIEDIQYEVPLNVYGYSKFLFDQYVRKIGTNAASPVCGFRYFNVYGPREFHKGKMASVALHLNDQIINGEDPKLFAGSDRFKRDFVYVDDVVDMNLWFWKHKKSGIFNCGTGQAESFQAVADAVLAFHDRGKTKTVPFPDELKGRYQKFTQANMSKVRTAGYSRSFKTVAEGVGTYMTWLKTRRPE